MLSKFRSIKSKYSLVSKALFATTTTPTSGKEGMIKPPVQFHGVAANYANALYSIGKKDEQIESIDRDLQLIKEIYKQSPAIQQFLENPTIEKSIKSAEIETLLKEGKMSSTLHGFLSILVENKRLDQLPSIIDMFHTMSSEQRKELKVTVTANEPLTAANIRQIQKIIKNQYPEEYKDKIPQIIIESQIDEDLLGGFTLQIGNMYIDLSVKNKIDRVHSLLLQPVN